MMAVEYPSRPTSVSADSTLSSLLGPARERALQFVYQPIVHTADLSPAASEALCRPSCPGFELPLALFAEAARSGLIWELGRLVRRLATEPLRQDAKTLDVFVNIHPQELADPTLLDPPPELASVATRIVLEIGEQGALGELSATRTRINQLRARGFRVALDDLGTGHARLETVQELQLDYVKLDRSLVKGVAESRAARARVANIVGFARRRGTRVIGEGVERAADAHVLREVGCQYLQGWLFGRGEARAPSSTSADGGR